MQEFFLFVLVVLFFILFVKLDKIIRLLKALIHLELPTPNDREAIKIEFFTINNGQLVKVEDMALVKADEQLPLFVKFKDRKGNDALVDGKPNWFTTNEAMGTLTVAEDGMSALFVPSGQVGSLSVQLKADADLGEGIKEIIGSIDIEIASAEAVTVEISAGPAEPQP